MTNIKIQDGFSPELFKDVKCDLWGLPIIDPPEKFIIPREMIPFSKRNESKDFSEFVMFYEYDENFAQVIKNPEAFIDDLKRFSGIISPDCSLYTDSPNAVQFMNIARNRNLAYFFQKNGLYVIPNVRWGSRLTYTENYFSQKIAFAALPKSSILAIGTYGCCQSKEEKTLFREGLSAMLDELTPKIVLVYGRKNPKIFDQFENKTKFIHYPDYTSLKHKGVSHGYR